MAESIIGLALSGGGTRAIAFHLGCLRALHDLELLDKVRVLSTVSGGSVIGALYVLSHQPFPEFEKDIRAVLRRGLAWPVLRTTLFTLEGPKALFCLALVGVINIALFAVSAILRFFFRFAAPKLHKDWKRKDYHQPIRQFASATTILRRAMDDELFKGALLSQFSSSKPLLIINAADLRTGSAFYFSAGESGTWRLGSLVNDNISVAHAVTASAAHPLFLPPLDELLPFRRRDGSLHLERVTLTDGGVYDNLGLAPLWPDRDPSISLNVTAVDTIICCRAGHGLRIGPPSQFIISRLKSAFSCIHDRAQNSSMKRLFDLQQAGKLRNFVLPYLGQNDSRLKFPPSELVRREEVYAYPTNFSKMSPLWIDRLSLRGEQLTKALIAEHAPHFVPRSDKS